MNCWDTLKARHHNRKRKFICDGLKSFGMYNGQSAAKIINFFKVTDLAADLFTHNSIFRSVCSTSTRGDIILKMKTQSGFVFFTDKIREYLTDKMSRYTVTPYKFIRNFARGQFLWFLEITMRPLGYKIKRLFITHTDFYNGAVLNSYRASSSFKFFYPKTTFSVHKSSYICFCNFFHKISLIINNNVQRLSRKGVQASAWKRVASLNILYERVLFVKSLFKEDDIVLSLLKNKAAVITAVLGLRPNMKTMPYMDEDYYAIARPSTYRAFKDDLEGINQYTTDGYGKILRGEIGRYEGCRFVEQTNITAGTGSTANAAWNQGKSDWAFFMGEDVVAEAVAVPEEIRGKIPGDYGRDKGIAWYFLGGYGIVHTQAAQSRILMWDSAN